MLTAAIISLAEHSSRPPTLFPVSCHTGESACVKGACYTHRRCELSVRKRLKAPGDGSVTDPRKNPKDAALRPSVPLGTRAGPGQVIGLWSHWTWGQGLAFLCTPVLCALGTAHMLVFIQCLGFSPSPSSAESLISCNKSHQGQERAASQLALLCTTLCTQGAS